MTLDSKLVGGRGLGLRYSGLFQYVSFPKSIVSKLSWELVR